MQCINYALQTVYKNNNRDFYTDSLFDYILHKLQPEEVEGAMQIHKYPKHLPYINYRMLHKRVVCVYLEGIIIRLTAQLLRCALYMCTTEKG